MSLETKIMDELKTAMRAKDEAALRTLRAIKAAILIEKTSGKDPEAFSEADETKMLQKMAKQRKDSLQIYQDQGRADLAAKEEEELVIIARFLPEQISAEALKEEIAKIISESGASSPADMGKVIGLANKAMAGRAEGKAISDAVKELLNNMA
jgi:uncharacterized protein YqeY